MRGHMRIASTTALLILALAGWVRLSVSQAPHDATCREPNLTDHQRELLDKYLILREEDGSLTLSHRLGYSCEIRKEAASWISDMISGRSGPDDKTIETSHIHALNQIVLRVWPAIANSPAFPSDGALAFDKWNMLSDADISDDTVGRIVSPEVLKSGLWTAEAHLMFSRNLEVTPGLIEKVLADNKSDIISKLYALALKTRIGSSSLGLSMESVIGGVQLTKTQAKVVESLRRRIEAHEPAKWTDVEDLSQDELAGWARDVHGHWGHHFTGKERDAESGNDYFGARYYASSMGRWLSPDKPFADQHAQNPQSWNLYAYARNNPLTVFDPNGEAAVVLVNGNNVTIYFPVSFSEMRTRLRIKPRIPPHRGHRW